MECSLLTFVKIISASLNGVYDRFEYLHIGMSVEIFKLVALIPMHFAEQGIFQMHPRIFSAQDKR